MYTSWVSLVSVVVTTLYKLLSRLLSTILLILSISSLANERFTHFPRPCSSYSLKKYSIERGEKPFMVESEEFSSNLGLPWLRCSDT